MERKKKEREDGMILFQKFGGGTFRLRKGRKQRIIKINQRFWAFPEEVSEAHRDTIRPVDPGEEPQPAKVEAVETKYTLRSRGGGGWYDVVNEETGKPINDRALKREAADQMLEGLNA